MIYKKQELFPETNSLKVTNTNKKTNKTNEMSRYFSFMEAYVNQKKNSMDTPVTNEASSN